jgi:hypothetical protein
MSDTAMTLMNIFFSEPESFQARITALESVKTLSHLKDLLMQEGSRITLPAAMDEVKKSMQALMNTRIEDILIPAWNKYLPLRKYRDKERYPPDKTVMVPIFEHTVRSEHQPYIELLINDQPVGRINFFISISLVLRGIILVVRDARIKEVKTGECSAKGKVSCEGILIIDKTSETVRLPGTISLGQGIPIL